MTAKRLLFLGNDRSPRCLPEKIQIRELKPGEILCRITLATICSSDLHTLKGLRKEAAPCILGHEGVAVVVQNNRGGDISVGQRIVFSICDSCFKCNLCQKGLPQKCVKIYKYGHTKVQCMTSDLTGCYASHIILFPGTRVVKVPNHVTDKMAAPINCALATMVNAVSHVPKLESGRRRVLVQGAGILGIYGCALLHDAGFERIYCSDRLISRLQFVRLFGGESILAGEEFEKIEENSLDVVIEVCGVRRAIPTGMELLRPGGTYIFVGLVHPKSEMNITAEQLIRKCLTLKGIHNYAPEHLEKAVEFISRTATKYPWEKLVGPSYPLAAFEEAVLETEKGMFHRVAINPNI